MKEWFALHTRPYSERKVASSLDRHDIETFVPETQNTSQGSRTERLPFFPGYMFIRLDMKKANPSQWRFTQGVRYIVSYGDEPIPVTEEVVRTIQQQLAALESRKRQPRAGYQAGDRVRITTGPLKDMVALFDAPTGPSERVTVLLEVMRRYQRVRVSKSALEKVDADRDNSQGKRPRRTRGQGRRIRS